MEQEKRENLRDIERLVARSSTAALKDEQQGLAQLAPIATSTQPNVSPSAVDVSFLNSPEVLIYLWYSGYYY
jgi:hypothetical protein